MVRTILHSPPEMAARLQMQVKNSSFTRLAGRAERLLDQQGRALEETLAALHEVLAGQGLT